MTCLLCGQSLPRQFSFTDLLYLKKSRVCLCCSCQASFEPIGPQHCPACAKPGQNELCLDCHYWQEQGQVVEHTSLYHYNEAMKAYFSRYKFEGDYLLRAVFSQDIKLALKSYKDYTLVPVPLSPEGLAKRRFNQVTAFLDHAGLSYQELLGKKDGVKQSSKTRQERLASCQTFYLTSRQPLPAKILLIDDIYTTGATLNLIRQLFQQAGVKELKTFSLAR
ncbi:ComF family protein [Streptococcus cuniculipharyngis]|uniref:ComF family protein n=1 Tax=Streptococcus cuniculipharyngis TaxID=1562651 RepID=A0A5C5SE68_9STRE|nr:ComF family protein [Streptococcus cuniculipharyngis]TWS98091.1 ComF family protein [Streptococcus cuniculipharyngis]